MITSRLLPRDEWHRLAGTELETVHPHLPQAAQIVVVEADDRIIGCWAVFPLLHVEGVWIAPDYRGNPRVVRHLLKGMSHTALAMGAQAVTTAALTDEVAGMLERLGAVELHGRHFSLGLGLRRRPEPVTI